MSTKKLSKALTRVVAHIKVNAKAYVALGATTATGLADITAGGETGAVLAAIGAVLTAYLTWRTPNADPTQVAGDTETAIAAVEDISPEATEVVHRAESVLLTIAEARKQVKAENPEIYDDLVADLKKKLLALGVAPGKRRKAELQALLVKTLAAARVNASRPAASDATAAPATGKEA